MGHLWALNSAEMPYNKPKWLIGHQTGYFCGLGSMGHSWKYFNQAQLIIGGPFKYGFKKLACTKHICWK